MNYIHHLEEGEIPFLEEVAPAAHKPTQRMFIAAPALAPPFRRPVTPAPRATLS